MTIQKQNKGPLNALHSLVYQLRKQLSWCKFDQNQFRDKKDMPFKVSITVCMGFVILDI